MQAKAKKFDDAGRKAAAALQSAVSKVEKVQRTYNALIGAIDELKCSSATNLLSAQQEHAAVQQEHVINIQVIACIIKC